jgi:hypothetical protein
MRWRIRRIVNGCAAQQLVARQDVIASEFISYGLVIRAIIRTLCLKQAYQFIQADAASRRGLIQALVLWKHIANFTILNPLSVWSTFFNIKVEI